MKKTSTKILAAVAMLVGTFAGSGPSWSADGARPVEGFCTVKGNLTWTRSGDDYAMRLEIPLNTSTATPSDCEGSLGEIGSFTCGPTGTLACYRRIDTFFGTLTGTVGRLGACDHRPAEPGHRSGTLYGLHLSGHIYFYRADLRRVYGPGHDLELIQMPIDEPSFPGSTPAVGHTFMDGNGPYFYQPDSGFGLGNDFSMRNRIFGNCPPGGDPKAATTLSFGIVLPDFLLP